MKYFVDLLNNNQGVVSVIIFAVTFFLAWITGFFTWIKNETSKRKRVNKIICAWRLHTDIPNVSNEFIEYKFGPSFQNKNDEIIRDFWINFSSSGFQMTAETTPHTARFDGWNIRDEALNLTLKNGDKFAPQNIIEPFTITIKLRKDLPKHSAWIYISYGINDSKKRELNFCLTHDEIKKFIDTNRHTGKDFLEYIGATSSRAWKVKMLRLFWK